MSKHAHKDSLPDIKARVQLSDLVAASVALHADGVEHKGLCPFHHEKTPSFTVNNGKGFYKCFGCGEQGDHFDFLQEARGMTLPEAIKYLKEWTGVYEPAQVVAHPAKAKAAAEWQPLPIVPESAPYLMETRSKTIPIYNPKRAGTDKEFTQLNPKAVYRYYSALAQTHGYVLRCEFPDGGKFTPQVTWCRNSAGEERWCMTSFANPRPLYNLPSLLYTAKAVLLVEGEKCVDAVAQAMKQQTVLTWPGGTNGVEYADWRPLAGRTVVIWPDNDEPGLKAAEAVRAKLEQLKGTTVIILSPPAGKPKGWDAADAIAEGWKADDIRAFLNGQTAATAPAAVEPPPPPMPPAPPPPAHEDEYTGGPAPADSDRHFRPLGYNSGTFYFYTARGKQVMEVSGNRLKDKATLLMLAPKQFWEREYQGFSGQSVDSAVDDLIGRSYNKGVFRPELLRGRGAWEDDGRIVIHTGDKLLVDGAPVALASHNSRYIYEAATPLPAPLENPLTNAESAKLYELCTMLTWERPMYARLLAGWCVIAPVCGALSWRPHVWITSPAGGGKSWVQENILRKVLGDTALMVQGCTSEAGIRQALRHDARPVLFDEAEGENQRASMMIESVMALVRQASSETGGKILKGTQRQDGKSFEIRSCFAFSSIGVGIKQHADATRITVLELIKDNSPAAQQHFDQEVKPFARQLLTPEWCKRLRARVIKHINTLRANADIFSDAAGEALQSKRLGDQIGALLAGAYLLNSTRVISLEEARQWMMTRDWTEYTTVAGERDELKLLNRLMEHRISFNAGGAPMERTVGELVAIAGKSWWGSPDDPKPDKKVAEEVLGRYGMKVSDEMLCISTGNSQLAHILRETAWSTGWGRVLKRIEGSDNAGDRSIRIGGSVTKVTRIPLARVVSDE